jgi:hypothetical protein
VNGLKLKVRKAYNRWNIGQQLLSKRNAQESFLRAKLEKKKTKLLV